jgi:hypothetical protein
MHAYKTRVEFFGDICRFMLWLEDQCSRRDVDTCSVTKVPAGNGADMVWEFNSALCIQKLLRLMRRADRAHGGALHIMHETLQPAAQFDLCFRRWEG